MKRNLNVFLIVLLFVGSFLASCATIPREAPELSSEMGNRIAAIETAHLALLHKFFDLKRENLEQFLQEVWIPRLTEKALNDSAVQKVWTQVVNSKDPSDRSQFMLKTTSRLQKEINKKREQLIVPLDAIERQIEQRIEEDYSQVKTMNTSLTNLLLSSSKLSEIQSHYLKKLGISDDKITTVIDNIDNTVDSIVKKGETISNIESSAKDYGDQLNQYKEMLSTKK
jgi:hypothetical protein